ncbi:MAG: response regulator [Candidatus Rokubacteria bacterium]|nr:response regulator [Candidatus Rokubacteria bacterium]
MTNAAPQERRVLVVDDDVAVGRVFEDLLRAQGFTVRVAYSGGEGVRAVRECRPDVVLLDVAMPDGNGLDVLTTFETIDRSIPVIMVTGSLDDRLCRLAMERGAYSWLTKPVDLGTLERVITLALGRRPYYSAR